MTGKKTLVTGGCGFIGRAVTEELIRSGRDVRVLDSLVQQVHGDETPERRSDVEYIFADIREPDAVAAALDGVDEVVHLAAEVGVGQSQYEIARYVGGNDLGTAVLLEAMIDTDIERIAVASSMSVYGEGLYRNAQGDLVTNARRRQGAGYGWNPVGADGAPLFPVVTDEQKPVDLASIYALTKYAQERAVLIFGEAYGRKAVALRLFNVFGVGQALSNPYTGVLANFSARLINDQRPLVFEDGEQQRDFVHVKDVARAFRLALEKPDVSGQVINIGSGAAYRIADIARMVAQAMAKPGLEPEILNNARSGDIRHCFADIGKARELLGFSPQHQLETSLDELVAWVRQSGAVDRGTEMKKQLEARGLVQ